MLSNFVDLLAEPLTDSSLALSEDGSSLVSVHGHGYRIAESGYVIAKGPTAPQGDDAAMVSARETFLSSGQFGPFVEAVTEAVHDALDEAHDPEESEPAILDLGAGTGYYLAHTLDDIAGARGVGIDVSEPAASRLASAHDRALSILADASGKLPLTTGSFNVVTSIFAPINVEECARVLREDGQLVLVAAVPGHLSELRAPLGIHDVDIHAVEELQRSVEEYFQPVGDAQRLEFMMNLDQHSIATQIGMSPSARHLDPDTLAERVKNLPDRLDVRACAVLQRYRPRTQL